jgi:hypothetical protein
MKRTLLFAILLTSAIGSSAARIEMGSPRSLGIGTSMADVPGVIINGQKARVKPGYKFARESKSSVSVWKIGQGVASMQTGMLSCTGRKKTCEAFIDRELAYCSGGCYFVGAPGGLSTQ